MATPVPSSTPPSRPTSTKPNGPPPSAATTKPAIAKAPVAVQSRAALVKRGQLRSNTRYLFYGPEGVGKSSLVADAPRPLFLDLEDGTRELEVARYPFNPDERDEFTPRDFGQVMAALDDLATNAWDDIDTVALDTVSKLEELIHRHLCKREGKEGIEDFGFAKGYIAAVEELRLVLAKLDAIRARGKAIALVGHSIVSTFKNPEGADYDRYNIHVHHKFGGQLKQWVDVVGFIRFEGGSSKLAGEQKNDSARARGWTTGRRLIQLSREAAWDAKCRLPMPTEVELGTERPWQPFRDAALATRDPKILAQLIEAELVRIGVEEFTTKAGKATTATAVRELAAKSDTSTLSRMLAGLRDIATIEHQES